MQELITVDQGQTYLAKNIDAEIAEFERQVKEIKAKEDELKAALLEEMRAKGIKQVTTPLIQITYIAPTERETFDSKRLRSECPDIYDAYADFKQVKDSIRIKVL